MIWKELLPWRSRTDEPTSSEVAKEPSVEPQDTLPNETNPFASLLAALPAQEASEQPDLSTATPTKGQGLKASQGASSEVHPTLSQLSDLFASEQEASEDSQSKRPLETFAQVSPFGSLHSKPSTPGALNIVLDESIQLDEIVGIFDAIANEPKAPPPPSDEPQKAPER